MSKSRTLPQILVLSDSPKLARAIELNLRDRWQVKNLMPSGLKRTGMNRQPTTDKSSLFIIALSSPASESIVILARASLAVYVARHINRNPLLIISPEPFEPDEERHIRHLRFPFSTEELNCTVGQLLNHAPPG